MARVAGVVGRGSVDEQVLAEDERALAVKDEVVRLLWKKGGRACAADLANELEVPTSAKEVVPVLETLESEGILRQADTSKDPRNYKRPYQTVYEVVR